MRGNEPSLPRREVTTGAAVAHPIPKRPRKGIKKGGGEKSKEVTALADSPKSSTGKAAERREETLRENLLSIAL